MAEDRDLIALLKAGNVDALEQLIMRWRSRAEEYANSILHDHQYAEDAVQEALIKAWCIKMGLQTDDDTVAKYFRLNLERGIAHLCGTGFIKNIDDLLMLAVKE